MAPFIPCSREGQRSRFPKDKYITKKRQARAILPGRF